MTGCDDLNQTECENTEGCEWEGSDNTPGEVSALNPL